MNGNKVHSNKVFRKELLTKRAELLMSLGFNFKGFADAERNSEDAQTVALQDEILHLGLDRVLFEQLKEVESALDRLASGDYGTCAICDNSISSKRLHAIAWATQCVDCKDNELARQAQEVSSLHEVFR